MVFIHWILRRLVLGIAEFKFRINGDWNSSEFPAGMPNRVLLVPIGSYSFHGIYDNFIPNSVPVTFNCIMEYQIATQHFNNLLDYLEIAGSYNGFLAGEQLMDIDGDEVYSLTLAIDTNQSKTFTYQFRINGDWALAEFPEGSHRSYTIHDPSSGGANTIDVWFADLDPFIGMAPMAKNVSIQPFNYLAIGTTLNAIYTYEDINLDPEGATTFHWFRTDGTYNENPVTLLDDTIPYYQLTEADAGKYIFMTITPKAISESGSNAANTLVGTPVQVNVGPIWNLSLSEPRSNSIQIYPNPSGNLVHIQHQIIIHQVEVYNLNGQKIALFIPDRDNISLDFSSLDAGVYIIKISDSSDNIYHHRQIITR
jgi:hypothetical protein